MAHKVKAGDANIDRARSKVASWFLQESEGDVLLMVDSDNAWEKGDLRHIAEKALDFKAVVGGMYPKRAFGGGYAFRVTDGAAGEWHMRKDELIPAEFVGTGFIAIPRTVLAEVAKGLPTVVGDFRPFFMPFIVKENGVVEYPTDDWAFCKRVRDAGFPIYVSTFPRITHEGSYTFRMVDAEAVPPPEKDVVLHIGERPKVPA